ncbi:hypothetical protein KY307_00660 [Candidatus Woesearchaeota archaeon]|nr:hypothetical protein [Candidatus Woesearchaeota archaeon]
MKIMKYELRSMPGEYVDVSEESAKNTEFLILSELPNIKDFMASFYLGRDKNPEMWDYFVVASDGSYPKLADKLYRKALEKDSRIWDEKRKSLPVPDVVANIYKVELKPPYRGISLYANELCVEGRAGIKNMGEANLREWWLENCLGDDYDVGRALAKIYYSILAGIFIEGREIKLDFFAFDFHAGYLALVLDEKKRFDPLPKTYRIKYKGSVYFIEDPEKRFFTSEEPRRQIYQHFILERSSKKLKKFRIKCRTS